jgi:hypothetical protein
MCTTRSRFILNLRSYLFRPVAINRDQIYLHEILLNIIKFFTLKIKFKINVVILKILRRMRLSRDKLISNNTKFKFDFDLQEKSIYTAETAAHVPHYPSHFITRNRANVNVLMSVLITNSYYVIIHVSNVNNYIRMLKNVCTYKYNRQPFMILKSKFQF